MSVRITPFRAKSTFLRVLSMLALEGNAPDSDVYRDVFRMGFKKGKHGGRQRGAFGSRAAKAHRQVYLRVDKASVPSQ